MSSQRGNDQKSGPPKYKNSRAFKNNLHDSSKKTKTINSLDMPGLCVHCKDILDWKIKYKKYKPITQPKTCVKCSQKTVNRSYYTVCMPCIELHSVCGKCAKPADPVIPVATKTQQEINQEFEANLLHLREREKRTVLRIANAEKSKGDNGAEPSNQADRSQTVKEAYIAAHDNLDSSSDEEDDDKHSCD